VKYRILTGASDGRIRVWQGKHTLLGEVTFNTTASSPTEASQASFAAHDGRIHSMVIDERSRYLFTGDNKGDITVWRLDNKGWYQLLRKFRKQAADSPSQANGANTQSEYMQKMEALLSW
jgi:WD40 repeat protein